jgi:hypothetical protein
MKADRIDLSGGHGNGAGGLSPEERLARFAQRYDSRLEALMNNENLSTEQRDALAKIRSDFAGLVDRLGSAIDTLDPGTATRAFQRMRQEMSEAARAVVKGDEPTAPATAMVGGREGMGEVGPPSDDGPSLEERLTAAQSRVDARFESFANSREFTAEQAAAFEAAHKQFTAVLDGLRDAFKSGEHGVEFLREGFKSALEDLSQDVASIVGDEHYGKPDVSGGSTGFYGNDGRSGDEGGPKVTFSRLA